MTLWRLSLLLALSLLVACGEADRESVFETLRSPRGDYVLIATVIEPWFPQGPHRVAIYVERGEGGERVRVAKAALAYDGVPFTKKNIGMRWIGAQEALVCLRATDRPDQGVRVTVHRDTPKGELRPGC